MAVRHFDGIDDYLTFTPPAVGDHAYTFAALIQKNGDSSSLTFFSGREAAGGGSNVEAMGFNANFFGVGNDHAIVSADAGTIGAITVASDWMILVGRIPEPTPPGADVGPQFSAYSFATGTWTHESPGHSWTVAAANPGGIMRVGYVAGLESFKAAFTVGAIGYWDVMFTTTDAEQLSTNLATSDWANVQSANLQFLADFNQASTATAVTDLSGNGLDQTGITGTDVLTDNDPPGWTFGVSDHHEATSTAVSVSTTAAGSKASAGAAATGISTSTTAAGSKSASGSASSSASVMSTATGHNPAVAAVARTRTLLGVGT